MAQRKSKYTVRHEQDTDLRIAQGFTTVPNVIVKNPHIKPEHKALYILLQSFNWANAQGQRKDEVWASQETLATELCAAERSVRTYLYALQEMGLIEISVTDNGNNVYTLKKVTANTLRLIEKSNVGQESDRKNLPVPPEKFAGAHRKNLPPNNMKGEEDEGKHAAAKNRVGGETDSDESSGAESAKRDTPPSPPRRREKFLPGTVGSRNRDGDEVEGVKKIRDGKLPDDYEDYNTKHWVMLFKRKMQEVGIEYVPSWVKEQAIIRRIVTDGVEPEALARNIEWFAKNYKTLGVKTPSVAALRGYWNTMQERIGTKTRKRGNDDNGGMVKA